MRFRTLKDHRAFRLITLKGYRHSALIRPRARRARGTFGHWRRNRGSIRPAPNTPYCPPTFAYSRPEIYWPRWARAPRKGALDTRMTPAKGCASSRIRKIAPATDSAQTPRVVTTVRLAGA